MRTNTCHLTTRELHFESQGTGDVVELGGLSLTSPRRDLRLCISIDSQRHTSASMGGLVCLKRYQSLIGPPAVVPVADWLSLPNLPYSHLLLSTKSRSVYSINGLRLEPILG